MPILLWTASVLLLFFSSAPSAQTKPAKLTLAYCLDAAMENNRELIQAREAVRQVEGSRVVVRSRFHPHVELTGRYEAERTEQSGETTDEISSTLRFSQRLFEYGPDFAEEVQMREELRKAVFAYESKVYEVLASVWETYHMILLQERQIAIRRESRKGFQEDYERKKARYQRRLATESDVLNAQLNVLSEDLAINNLEREQFNNKMKLLRLIGRPIGTEVELEEEQIDFPLDQEEAVRIGLANSVQIALASERLDEQARVVREIAWEYSPDLKLSAGVEDGRRKAQVDLDKQGKTWGADLSSEYALSERQPPEARDQARWSAQVEARIPIFEGGSRIGREIEEKARLRRLRTYLNDLRASAELGIRQAYQSVLEARERQRIQEERVRIARRRLEINQILKDRGQADESLLETVRQQFFNEQDRLFGDQAAYIKRIAALRKQMGYFE